MKVVAIGCANKAMQVSKTARHNFNIFFSHNGSRVCYGLLPVVRARFCHLMAGVRASMYDEKVVFLLTSCPTLIECKLGHVM